MAEVDLVALASHVASRAVQEARGDFMRELELFGQKLQEQWRKDLGKLRDDLTAKGLLDDTKPPAEAAQAKDVIVLVVEDNQPMRNAFVRALDFVGLQVLEAQDGEVAAKILVEHTLDDVTAIDVVIADVNMPKNGYTLLEHVRKEYPGIEVILTSGYNVDQPRAARMGAFGFLPKPFDLQHAVRLVEYAAERRRLRFPVR